MIHFSSLSFFYTAVSGLSIRFKQKSHRCGAPVADRVTGFKAGSSQEARKDTIGFHGWLIS
jgi:hypothetical protein